MTQRSPCRFLDWDSSFFGVRIGRIEGNHLTPSAMADVLVWADAHDIACLYFLCAPDDDESVGLAEAQGFHLVDIRINLNWHGTATSVPTAARPRQHGVRRYRVEDRRDVERIAADAYQDTRFAYDTHFAPTRVSALYQEWIAKSCDGDADAVFIVLGTTGVGGFITCHKDEPSSGHIGLVGVNSAERGSGVGSVLVDAALAYFVEQGIGDVHVVTQGRNVAAQRLYQKCGFRTHTVNLWYHKWFGEQK